jgi:SAM-dependent methyltransferase
MGKSLESSFLRFIEVKPEIQARNQGYYEQFFTDCQDIVDLGCGDGDFVKLMNEHGYHAIGVDLDPVLCAAARERGIPVICDDVFNYLRNAPPESVDGFFSSHLVEHLHYEQVLELIELCYRALRPGGVLVLTTPNVRGLIAHLEMFWLHYGHVNFYHPRLLAFFMTYVGYERIEMGENPWTESHLLQDLRPLAQFCVLPSSPPRDLMLTGTSWWKRLIFKAKLYLASYIVLPYVEWMIQEVNQLGHVQREIIRVLLELDRPFECYVVGRKPHAGARGENLY